MEGTIRPETISRFKKQRFLKQLTEKQFRDEVIRPLFYRRGLQDGRDTCGVSEEGKDAIFIEKNALGMEIIYVVQTKIGNLNLSSRITNNIIEAITQLKTALNTKVIISLDKNRKALPDYAMLCTNGTINEQAKQHICDGVNDKRIKFLDRDDIIPQIDEYFHEYWYGIDADKFPYIRKLKDNLINPAESSALADILPSGNRLSPVTDDMFVSLQLTRLKTESKKIKGRITQVPKVEQIPITGLLSKKERLFLVLGEAGSGKSTCLRKIAYTIIEKSLNAQNVEFLEIPIILRCIDIVKEDKSIIEICASETLRLSAKSCFSLEDLSSGNITILLDALDEVSSDEERGSILSMLDEFHRRYPECRIVLTSRDYSFLENFEGLSAYAQFRLSPINWKQADKIIKRLHSGKSLAKEAIQEILRRLQDVHGIELNPLLVTIFVATTDYSKSDIPANITELFKKYTEMMLGRWDNSKGLAQQFHAPLKNFLLKQIGFEMHSKRITSIPLEECKKTLISELRKRIEYEADIEQLTDEILYRSGLFRVIKNQVEFRHMLIQEFFAGGGITASDFVQTVIADEWWRRALIFHFGENPDNYELIEATLTKIGKRDPHDIFKATITIGLSLQACYLVSIEKKVDLFRWIIEKLAMVGEILFKDKELKSPLSQFLSYYLFGRDATACNILNKNLKSIAEPWKTEILSPSEKELRTFWCIIGLLECGNLLEAEKEIKLFHPTDHKLLLFIHLGCFFISAIRILKSEEKAIANRIMEKITPQIKHLREQLVKEVHSELLEIRKGEIKPIEIKKEH